MYFLQQRKIHSVRNQLEKENLQATLKTFAVQNQAILTDSTTKVTAGT